MIEKYNYLCQTLKPKTIESVKPFINSICYILNKSDTNKLNNNKLNNIEDYTKVFRTLSERAENYI